MRDAYILWRRSYGKYPSGIRAFPWTPQCRGSLIACENAMAERGGIMSPFSYVVLPVGVKPDLGKKVK